MGAKGEVTTQELTRGQQAVARRTAEARAIVPDFTVGLRAPMRSGDDTAVAVIAAAARALRNFPRLNGAYRDGRFELYSRVNVGFALVAADVVVIPTVFDADQKDAAEIAAAVRELTSRARSGEITSPELAGGTFTVWNGAPAARLTPVINPPQAGALGFGAVGPDGAVELSLACDHRIVYPPEAAHFLTRVAELL